LPGPTGPTSPTGLLDVLSGPVLEAAPRLLGATLTHGGVTVRLTEIEAARSRRGSSSDRDLARGPARLCSALGIDLGDDGLDLASSLVLGPVEAQVSTGPRVGLRLAADRPWRFWVTGDPTVSRYVPAKPRPPRP
jgi:DNA-3-methyladenine glycosylase